MKTPLLPFVLSLSAPALRQVGDDENHFGGALPSLAAQTRARERLDRLFDIRTTSEARAVLKLLEQHGSRAEWTSYRAHAGKGWAPDAHDTSMVRKAEFAVAHRDGIGEHGMVAWDAMRASVVAGWSYLADLLRKGEALEALTSHAKRVHDKHASWKEVGEHLLWATHFLEGVLDPAFAAVVLALSEKEGLWSRSAWPARPASFESAKAEDSGDRVQAASREEFQTALLRLTVDCPGCALPLSAPGLTARAVCSGCATEITLAPSDWGYFFAREVGRLALTPRGDITNDFGKRFFSRSEARACELPLCACGAAIPLDVAREASERGGLDCPRCGVHVAVRVADDFARAVSDRARFVVEGGFGATVPHATTPCLGCANVMNLDRSSPRIQVCAACGERSFVDAGAWAKLHGSAVRATVYLLLAPAPA